MFYDDVKFDKRIVETLIKKKLVSREEYEEYLKSLPDLSDKVEEVTLTIEPGQFDQVVLPPVEEEEEPTA